MSDSHEDDLDRRIRGLISKAGAEAPIASGLLPTTKVSTDEAATPFLVRKGLLVGAVSIVAVLAVVAVVLIREPDASPSLEPVVPTSGASTTVPTSTAASSSTTGPSITATPSDVITRPFVDPKVCGSGEKALYVSREATYIPFAVGFAGAKDTLIPLQVLASSTGGVAKPFAVLLRLPVDPSIHLTGPEVVINGAKVSIQLWPNGNGSARWTLSDGTWAYLRSRDLDEGSIVNLIRRLTPRKHTAAIPGFDVAPSSEPDALVLLHEHLNIGLTGSVTRFQCSIGPNHGIYHIDAVSGDPVYVYFGIIDRPRPYAIAVNGSGALAIDGPSERAITSGMIVNADSTTWNALPAIGPFGA
jgi:hypothetical protein